ncbi:uncharacterized protein MONOS_3169 [Monocercomonoides exilis]|uniref:uncharacterized protein n=1 Tax=Monocercomonoides exilis TaxID=2049356 RepID=UPI00355A0855|nr:hypothetical protein MONOS_3169 [Monocercomonoides exilis]|eukprot:MONOS_3169.1-p1 / transcript=MONOS_3169.1 / gene=MONOS_3169 / organism=Monocercomonoides_exilis_PA203 / gene_product=unspecified product / transcript_product=unspecified product / location=Mono_scaffold00072:79349-81019(+) / protein_length=557 / sequence_SO=supercontig / SO=protein_coding / is_pseudo=false
MSKAINLEKVPKLRNSMCFEPCSPRKKTGAKGLEKPNDYFLRQLGMERECLTYRPAVHGLQPSLTRTRTVENFKQNSFSHYRQSLLFRYQKPSPFSGADQSSSDPDASIHELRTSRELCIPRDDTPRSGITVCPKKQPQFGAANPLRKSFQSRPTPKLKRCQTFMYTKAPEISPQLSYDLQYPLFSKNSIDRSIVTPPRKLKPIYSTSPISSSSSHSSSFTKKTSPFPPVSPTNPLNQESGTDKSITPNATDHSSPLTPTSLRSSSPTANSTTTLRSAAASRCGGTPIANCLSDISFHTVPSPSFKCDDPKQEKLANECMSQDLSSQHMNSIKKIQRAEKHQREKTEEKNSLSELKDVVMKSKKRSIKANGSQTSRTEHSISHKQKSANDPNDDTGKGGSGDRKDRDSILSTPILSHRPPPEVVAQATHVTFYLPPAIPSGTKATPSAPVVPVTMHSFTQALPNENYDFTSTVLPESLSKKADSNLLPVDDFMKPVQFFTDEDGYALEDGKVTFEFDISIPSFDDEDADEDSKDDVGTCHGYRDEEDDMDCMALEE